MRKKIMCLLGVTIVVSITCAKTASAVALSGQNLTITPIAEKSFYMYDYRPRGVYHVAADVRNDTDVAHYYRADLVDAFTSENGAIAYGDKPRDHGIRQMATNPTNKIAKIPPKTTERLVFTLKADKGRGDGVKMGGLRVTEIGDNSEAGIQNNIAMITTIIIKRGPVETKRLSDIQLRKLTLGHINGGTRYVAKMSHSTHRLMKDMTAFLVLQRDGKTVFKKMNQVSIGPNRNFKLVWVDNQEVSKITSAKLILKKSDKTKVFKVKFDDGGHEPTFPYGKGIILVLISLVVGIGMTHFIRRRGLDGV